MSVSRSIHVELHSFSGKCVKQFAVVPSCAVHWMLELQNKEVVLTSVSQCIYFFIYIMGHEVTTTFMMKYVMTSID